MELTKEQCLEVLKRFRYYSYWMYNTKEGVDQFREENKRSLEHLGKIFFLTIEENGLFKLQLENEEVFAMVKVSIETCPPTSSPLINSEFKHYILNAKDLSKENLEFFDEAAIFCSSYFQRLNAFTFFYRMEEVTIDIIATYLSLYQEKPKTNEDKIPKS